MIKTGLCQFKVKIFIEVVVSGDTSLNLILVHGDVI